MSPHSSNHRPQRSKTRRLARNQTSRVAYSENGSTEDSKRFPVCLKHENFFAATTVVQKLIAPPTTPSESCVTPSPLKRNHQRGREVRKELADFGRARPGPCSDNPQQSSLSLFFFRQWWITFIVDASIEPKRSSDPRTRSYRQRTVDQCQRLVYDATDQGSSDRNLG